ncbi:hypothetical protein CH273_17515 [Rhodococcus sp. 05-339-2]|uniref:Rv1733c family protein n=1 Tax=Nocardiaceae TaxID=85025 RepID=UPI00050BF6D5|nr:MULTISPECIES: hypothetical protein [unclassified Rhodococcus (in: high G+C Gram-positive bacteria)]AJW41373.1 hypothetical protein NY08_3363 [Rhodococcus sp. B7740]OZD79912.1 hypothetical protein CH273_17515 [Rhodococcus sp. 05-339-2]
MFGYDVARWWHLAPWSSNPLMRGRDRAAAVLFAVAVSVVLALIPCAALVGSSVYLDLAAQSARTSATTRQVDAVVTGEPTVRSEPNSVMAVVELYATIVWEWPVGEKHSDEVRVPDGTVKGATVETRIDAQGDRVAEPATSTANVVSSVAAALGFWLGSTLVVITVLATGRHFDERARMREWDRAWLSFVTDRGRSRGGSA